jgi:plastocyanin
MEQPTSDQTFLNRAVVFGRRHTRTLLATSVVLIVIIILGVISYHKTSRPASVRQAAVAVTSQGLTPSVLSVKTGTQVTWTNSDSSAHEIAADPYPKNDSISGFDSTVVLQPNDSYSFSFKKAGTYHYHDQLNPFKINGTVIVK